MSEQIVTVRLDEDTEARPCRIRRDEDSEPLSRADAQALLTQAVTTPGAPSSVRVEAITPDPESEAQRSCFRRRCSLRGTRASERTSLPEVETRLDMLARCQAVTQARRACEFVGIVNDKAERFIVISAPTVDEMGYLVGDVLTKVLSPEDAHTFIQAMERLVAHYAVSPAVCACRLKP
ncbi:hypothetical protein C4901_09080 [Acidiferrobacter sp. SPIII_3]|uniref:hypothetical protein n=1 Tax=Acidiferrobacter sp. SPIII_3 TaxID=1281578 RepID=UPI000D7341B6|nr:hypothetical protein [Acidiferrobacter sp. SPIII_3]AWP23464.1 hypothetical protein C4901_09080 [Acidiferrobacter sp. SPIII_3]